MDVKEYSTFVFYMNQYKSFFRCTNQIEKTLTIVDLLYEGFYTYFFTRNVVTSVFF